MGSQKNEKKRNFIDEKIKLTRYTHGMGCACKLRPQDLEIVLKDFKTNKDSNVLVGMETSDDATVYKIDEHTAIVNTVDFFTPMVDDPYQFGEIAAANSLSDIYAMGAKPLFALNVVAFPSRRLPLDVLKKILKGARDKAEEAGINILGGHTIEDNEPKFGLVVTGRVDPARVITNSGAKPGDLLILTKPIGVGIISTGIKRGLVTKKIEGTAIKIMATLNKNAAECMEKYNINACTDITGFGLLGHLKEMLESAKVNAEVHSENVAVIDGTDELVTAGVVPGGTYNNLKNIEKNIVWNKTISETKKIILSDAQTSGGLLISIEEESGEKLIMDLHNNGVEQAAIIGKISKKGKGIINVK
ncbi:selenide, water dikinase SelD [Bacteroidota bacterium]